MKLKTISIRFFVLLIFLLAPASRAAEKSFELAFESVVSASRLHGPLGIFELIKEEYAEAKLTFLFSKNEVDFCLIEVEINDSVTYVALVSPKSGHASLKIDDRDQSKKLGTFSLKAYGQTVTRDGVIDDKSITSEHQIGIVFSVPRNQRLVFTASANGESGSKFWTFQRAGNGNWDSKISSEIQK
jgi:hypothetical protein